LRIATTLGRRVGSSGGWLESARPSCGRALLVTAYASGWWGFVNDGYRKVTGDATSV